MTARRGLFPSASVRSSLLPVPVLGRRLRLSALCLEEAQVDAAATAATPARRQRSPAPARRRTCRPSLTLPSLPPPPRAGQSSLQALRRGGRLPGAASFGYGRAWTTGVLPTTGPLSRSAHAAPADHAGPPARRAWQDAGPETPASVTDGSGADGCPDFKEIWFLVILSFVSYSEAYYH